MGEKMKKVAGAPKAAWEAAARYTTDGCSFALNLNFRECCVQHDYDYAEHHRESEKKRSELDKKLRICIKCRGWFLVAWLYYAAIRVFGWIPYWIKERRKLPTVEEDKTQNGH